ncbi:hypothetical protein HWV62_25512 [Athelia sp. TMB]|nr:hypothetical protein HWV62_25512 [Athelia sp. TMB]
MLSSDESEGEDVHTLTINEHYAKAFEYKKEREELAKLKEKYGSDLDEEEEEDSEEAESEDEDGEELTPAVDAAILRTLARIKRKDPEIYQAEKGIFEVWLQLQSAVLTSFEISEEQKKIAATKQTPRARKDKDKARGSYTSKPLTMRQAALDSALRTTSRSPTPEHHAALPHAEEQRALRSETIAVFQGAADDDDDDNLFVPREKTKDERERDEEEYRDFLQREVGEDLEGLVTIEEDVIGARVAEGEKEEDKEAEPVEGKKKKKKSKKDKGKGKEKAQETDQEFLMNYILNRGWIDRSANRVPTYKDIVGPSSSKPKESLNGDDDAPSGRVDIVGHKALSDDEDFDEVADRFETSYNFRFEEPDAATIKSYPRNLPSLVRREDTTRKEARERRKERKEEELLKKREEVKRLKGLKMKELRAKLERIGKEGGVNLEETKALQELDLDAEWDPDAHDAQMAGLYGDDEPTADDKPEWDDDIDIGDIPMSDIGDFAPKKQDKKKKKKKKKADEDDDQGVDVDAMDADVQPARDDEEEWDGTEEMRKRKLDEYMDEIYGLDFNDMVGDMPTRFKYTSVQPQSFALTPAEILMATDAELNQYLSVKKYAPYRKDNNWDKARGDRLKEFKAAVSGRTGGGPGWGDGGGSAGVAAEPVKKRKGKKERMKMKASEGQVEEEGRKTGGGKQDDAREEGPGDESPARKKRRRQKKPAAQE